jgi:hypothetical protein
LIYLCSSRGLDYSRRNCKAVKKLKKEQKKNSGKRCPESEWKPTFSITITSRKHCLHQKQILFFKKKYRNCGFPALSFIN